MTINNRIEFLDGKYTIEELDNSYLLLKKKITYSSDKTRMFEKYEKRFCSSFKAALIYIVRDCGSGCEYINHVLNNIDRLEKEIKESKFI
jgi:hypothetical protein